jgi:hypothetical protein
VAALLGIVAAAHAEPHVSPRAQALLSALPFTATERQKILDGGLVTTASPDSASNRELAITMAFLIADPPADLVAKFRTAADYTRDETVTAYGAIRDGTVADFAGVTLKPAGVAEARRFVDVQPGLDLNLSMAEIAAFSALGDDASVDAVETELRKRLLARYQAYREHGLAGVAPYARADGKESKPGDELAKAATTSHVLAQEAPEVVRALLDYPRTQPANAKQSFFWVNFAIDGRPTLSLTHRMSLTQSDGTYVLVDRHYYVSRSHNDLQIVAGVFPVDEGALVVYSNRTVTDQLGGFGAGTKQALGRKIMSSRIATLFSEIRSGVAH